MPCRIFPINNTPFGTCPVPVGPPLGMVMHSVVDHVFGDLIFPTAAWECPSLCILYGGVGVATHPPTGRGGSLGLRS